MRIGSDTTMRIRVTESEFQRDVTSVTDKAAQEPVMITRDGRDHVVMLSAAEYLRLKRGERRVGRTADLPEEWVDAVRNAEVPDAFAHLDAELK